MERGNTEHSPRLDDQLKHEVEGMMRAERPTHAEEWREPEPAGEDQPDPGALGEPDDRQPGTPPGMTNEEIQLRSDLAAHLTRATFPADESGLLSHLVDTNAPDRLRDSISGIRVFAGYSGWSPGQLEDEIAAGSWFVFDALPGDPFVTRPDDLWAMVLRRQGDILAAVAHFPPDPSLN